MYERVKVHFSFLCIPYNGVVMHPGVILHSLFQEKSISTPKTGVNRIKISCMTGGKNVTQVYFFFSACRASHSGSNRTPENCTEKY